MITKETMTTKETMIITRETMITKEMMITKEDAAAQGKSATENVSQNRATESATVKMTEERTGNQEIAIGTAGGVLVKIATGTKEGLMTTNVGGMRTTEDQSGTRANKTKTEKDTHHLLPLPHHGPD
jgi:hypothetical protein